MMNCVERYEAEGTAAKVNAFRIKQQLPYDQKVILAEMRAKEFYRTMTNQGHNVHVSVGGLDSITLLLFLRHIGLTDVPAVSVSSLEDKSIQRIHKDLGVIPLKPLKSKVEVIQEFGFPVLSKETAGKIDLLQRPTEKNATVRHAIITGETGEYGGNRTGTRMKVSQNWLERFAGYENANEGVNYQIAPFKVSDKCCYYLKEKPCGNYAREHDSFPYLGLMASEGGRRQKALMMHGCNYYGKTTTRSAPFAIFDRQDLLQLALDLQVQYRKSTGRSCGTRTGHCAPPRRNGRDVACAVSESIWRSGPTGSIDCGRKIPRSGNSGCTDAVRTRRQGKSSAGAVCWITSALVGTICFWTRTK